MGRRVVSWSAHLLSYQAPVPPMLGVRVVAALGLISPVSVFYAWVR